MPAVDQPRSWPARFFFRPIMVSAAPRQSGAAPERIRHFARIAWQVLLMAWIWLAADAASRHFLPQIPASLLGLGFVLALLWTRTIRREWLAHGAAWLTGEMLLFFVPAVVAVVQYPDLVRRDGLAILLLILGSTVCVMICTALAVDVAWRLQARLHARGKRRSTPERRA